MNVENFTPFTPATFVSAKEIEGYTTTILVKAAFAMRHQKVVKPLEQQLFPAGDIFPEGADSAASSLAYASDFVPYKVRADVLLSATAFRPADQPNGTFRVGMRVGNLVKELAVSGRREFAGILANIVEREPLSAIPITYENAFGGPKHAKNPVGQGHKSNALPSIECLDQRIRLPSDNIAIAGFGPISPAWEPRKSMIGTFGPDYLEKHWPGFPANFDERFFNAAPADQQFTGQLGGDEKIVLENLHPQHAIFVTQLPALRVVCVRENGNGHCELVPLVIDTLWMKPDAEQLVLVWRGRMSVQTPDALEIKRLGFLVEPLESVPEDAATYQRRLRKLMEEQDKEFAPELPPELVPPLSEDETVAGDDDSESDTTLPEVAALQAQAGRSPEDNPTPTDLPPLSPEAQAKYDEIKAGIEAEDRHEAEEEAASKWTREKVIAAVKEKQSLVDADLSGLDLSECDFTAADFRGATLDDVNFTRSLLTRATLSGCSLQRARFTSALLSEADLSGANLQRAMLDKAVLVAANLDGIDLTEAVLDGANLSSVTAERAMLRSASLNDVNFSKADLARAIMSRAQGVQVNFESSCLAAALCDHADFSGANFRKSVLTDSDFVGSKLNNADLTGVRAADANFTEAELKNASFRRAICDGMWLSSALADGADFQQASCIDLQLDGTSAKQANFSHCCVTSFRGSQRANFAGANFRHAHGTEPIFETCRLHGADFSYANFPGANFTHAAASRADFTAAELTGARFDHANCQDAVFATANLFQAIFAGVNLDGADIRDGNFYGVEFLDAQFNNLRFKNCNLQMTKLEQWAIKNR